MQQYVQYHPMGMPPEGRNSSFVHYNFLIIIRQTRFTCIMLFQARRFAVWVAPTFVKSKAGATQTETSSLKPHDAGERGYLPDDYNVPARNIT